MVRLWNALTRRKTDDVTETESKLARVLSLFDLTALSVGSTLGLGVYVLAGSVAHDIAGPAVILSFLIAGIASAFAGMCYAEFAARVPKAGSAYAYSYVTVGEFVAFTIGWTLILEHVIGTAAVSRSLSCYLDSLLDKGMSTALHDAMPINVNYLGDYPDLFAFGVVMLLTALLAFGVKKSSYLNNIFTSVNITNILIVIIAGSFKADIANWSISAENVPSDFGAGGFMPYGFAGVMAGAAKCFYGYVGFDSIAATGEEALNPQRNIPLAIIISLVVTFLSYFGISTVLTMMVPYFDQDTEAPLIAAFSAIDWTFIKWTVTIGALFAVCTCLLSCIFPLPRILYAMANDGVIFKKFSSVNNYTKTPVFATIVSGLFAAIMASILDLNHLIEMLSIGTLMAYNIVDVCVVVLRYQSEDKEEQHISLTWPLVLKQFFNGNSYRAPNVLTSHITNIGVILFGVISVVWCSLEKIYKFDSTGSIIALSVLAVVLIFILIVIGCQPACSIELNFKVPLVPLIPGLSIFCNLYLMFQLNLITWIRFLIWLALGYVIYFAYGIRHSAENTRKHYSTAAVAAAVLECANDAYEPDGNEENGKTVKTVLF